jgi:hypothetical protein
MPGTLSAQWKSSAPCQLFLQHGSLRKCYQRAVNFKSRSVASKAHNYTLIFWSWETTCSQGHLGRSKWVVMTRGHITCPSGVIRWRSWCALIFLFPLPLLPGDLFLHQPGTAKPLETSRSPILCCHQRQVPSKQRKFW